MTPMIDVVFQLLVYFLCTAGFHSPEQVLPTRLPPSGVGTFAPSPEVQELGPIQIRLRQPGGDLMIELNGRPCADVRALREVLELLAQEANLPVILDIAPEVELGVVVQIYDTCLLVGLDQINFAAPETG